MSKTLKISDELSLPLDAVTQTLVVYGGKGMGKTNFAAVFAEELSAARLRFSIIDPLGVSWGLRHSADGKSPGIELLILGGLHADIPIEPSGGAVIADLVADEEVDTLIDISRHPNGKMWSMGERIKFVTDYCTQLFQRQGERRRPIMQIIDEAGRFCPEKFPAGAEDIAKCVGAIEQLVEWGRNAAIGVTLITQRSARMNKSVSELADSMFAFRTVGPRSIAAIMDWFGEHVPKERHGELVQQLRKQPKGKSLVVSPGWLEYEGAVQIRLRHTFDSSRTPEAGERQKKVAAGAKPDLSRYQARMLETIEKAKENDPKLLKQELSRLRAQLAKSPITKPAETKIVEKPVVTDAQVKRVERVMDRLEKEGAKRAAAAEKLADSGREMLQEAKEFAAALGKAKLPQIPMARPARPIVSRPIQQRPPKTEQVADGDLQISKVQQRILNALAWYESLGNTEPTLTQIGAVALIDPTGGYFSNTVGPLATNKLIERGSGMIRLTDKGRALAQPVENVGTLEEYHDVLRQRIRKMRSASGKTIDMLDAIISHGGDPMTTEEVGAAVGIDHTGGYFSNTIGPLSTAGVIERRQGLVKPTEVLFPQGMFETR